MIVGVGCDITRIERFYKNTDALAKKILTTKELKIYEEFANEERKVTFLAGHFAAKEAIIKALDQDKLLSDIEILYQENGKPICLLEGYKVHISISHESEYAMAQAICEKK